MDRLKNIIVAVDFSTCSRNALAQATRIARWNGAPAQGAAEVWAVFSLCHHYNAPILA